MDVPSGVHLVGFAYNLAVVGVARTGRQLEDAINPVLGAIDNWMSPRGLELVHQKSEAIMLTRRWAYMPLSLHIGGRPIDLKDSLRSLGVFLDKRLTFTGHIKVVAKNASRSTAALARLMPNARGRAKPREGCLRLLSRANCYTPPQYG